MSSEDPLGIVELGNENIKCLIFNIKNNKAEILAFSTTPSNGFHNDVISNVDKATNSIRLSIGTAEKKAGVVLKKIHVVFEQAEFLCTKFSKYKKIDGSKISKDDIDFLLKEAKKQLLINDKNQSIIHIFNHNYIVDGKNFIEEPIGIYANSLVHEMTFVTAPLNNIKNMNQAFNNCDIEIERLISRTFALGVETLNNTEFNNGSAIIDFGSEKTSLGLFKNLALVHSVTMPIGVNHITKDISKVCSLDLIDSKNIRDNFDFSFSNNKNIFDENNFLKKDYFKNSNFRKISKNLILEVIKSRLDEILAKLKKQLIIPDFDFSSKYNMFLSGGGANLINLEKYFINFFGPNIKKIENNDENDLKKNFLPCLGALKIIKDGWETEAIPKKGIESAEKIGFFAKFFKF